MKIFQVIVLLLFIIAGCTGGGGVQQWYKHNATQVDFDRDSQECEIIAREMARQATLTGRREDPTTYTQSFHNCINAKGWSVLPPAQAGPAGNHAQRSLAEYKADGVIEVFGRSLAVPAGFVLRSNVVQGHGPTVVQNLLFQKDELFVNYTVQESGDLKFEPTDYPVQDPFFLYEQGKDHRKPDRLRWAVFAGNIQGSWVRGLGGYLLLGSRERITIVVTAPLPSPAEEVLEGMRLSPDQLRETEQFRNEWLPWLEGQI